MDASTVVAAMRRAFESFAAFAERSDVTIAMLLLLAVALLLMGKDDEGHDFIKLILLMTIVAALVVTGVSVALIVVASRAEERTSLISQPVAGNSYGCPRDEVMSADSALPLS